MKPSAHSIGRGASLHRRVAECASPWHRSEPLRPEKGSRLHPQTHTCMLVFFSGIRFNAPRHASRARNYGCKAWVQEARDVYTPSNIVTAMHGKVDACSPSSFNSLGPLAIAFFLRREPTPIPGQTIRHSEHAWFSISDFFEEVALFFRNLSPLFVDLSTTDNGKTREQEKQEKLF